MSFGDFLENLGFTDIYENTDHTFNATKEGCRYFHMYLSGYDPGQAQTDDSISIETDISYSHFRKEKQ
jgi:hypothetical protein